MRPERWPERWPVRGIDMHDDHAGLQQRKHDDISIDRDRHCQEHFIACTQSSFIERCDNAIDFLLEFRKSYATSSVADAGDQRGMCWRSLQRVCEHLIGIHAHSSFAKSVYARIGPAQSLLIFWLRFSVCMSALIAVVKPMSIAFFSKFHQLSCVQRIRLFDAMPATSGTPNYMLILYHNAASQQSASVRRTRRPRASRAAPLNVSGRSWFSLFATWFPVVVSQYLDHRQLGFAPSQNRTCAVNASGSPPSPTSKETLRGAWVSTAVPALCPDDAQFKSRDGSAAFPPPELPGFKGTTRPSDFPVAICLPCFFSLSGILILADKSNGDLPGCLDDIV